MSFTTTIEACKQCGSFKEDIDDMGRVEHYYCSALPNSKNYIPSDFDTNTISDICPKNNKPICCNTCGYEFNKSASDTEEHCPRCHSDNITYIMRKKDKR